MTTPLATFNKIHNQTHQILEETIKDNDLTLTLKSLNSIIDIKEKFINENGRDLEPYWNEIASELISALHAGVIGHVRLALTGLRNILEMTCHVFYYLDHKIEYSILLNNGGKSDKYVSSIISNELFFTSKYIKCFRSENVIEAKNDIISIFLKNEYSSLCDIVHARTNTLLKFDNLKIEYNQSNYKNFEKHYINICSIISTLYITRFNYTENKDWNELALKTNTIKELK
ncbi:hypothetical protein G3444_04505 [Shewanella baltica]|uniref:hypothetical protein n=1 Tax=Shewanella baltica TaxID=62322 RepID=UPI00217E4248|nr:hypothetical protein [Shewanella baltica]MCS6118178.1 hypothetical protein [Shewanella baltica]